MSECVGMIGRLVGHRFRARYSESSEWPPNTSYTGPHGRIYPADVVEITEASKNRVRTYEGDICERCGVKVDREGTA